MKDRHRILAAITLDDTGGGVAAVSRLIWRVFCDEWGTGSRCVQLLRRYPRRGLRPSLGTRIRFGAKLGALQAASANPWIFYSHLSLALVQRYVPGSFRRPYGVFLHGIEAWRHLTPRHQDAIKGASLVVANSSYTARRVSETHPWIGSIAVCPLALVDADPLPPVPRSAVSRPTVLIVGRLSAAERYKGHDQLLEAWPIVREYVPGARLVVAGDGDDAARLRAKAEGLRLSGAVEFAGFVSEAGREALYRSASAFAMPSLNEGFGLVYLEAMLHGLPCIGSIHDAAGDVIQDGVTGFLVNQRDTAALADRIVRLLQDRDLCERMGALGRARVEQQFQYDTFRTRFAALLRGAFGEEPGPAVAESPSLLVERRP